MRRLFVFTTGQYRRFWHSWNNMVEKILKPASLSFEVHVCVGLDRVWRLPEHLWDDKDRTIFETHLRNEWDLLQYPPQHLMVEWIEHDDPYLKQSIASLEHYHDQKTLDPYWFQYLVHRSGSCIEYAQISRLYDRVCSQYQIMEDDLMIRTRTDILLRHPLQLDAIFPTEGVSTKQIFHTLFPTCHVFDKWEEQGGREVSIFPPHFVKDRWIITLRKNLAYLMPLSAGSFLIKLAMHYGDWDTPEMNRYWFNAESQFRGCFRLHHFTLWEYSQHKDECYGNFDNLPDDFPVYAIYR